MPTKQFVVTPAGARPAAPEYADDGDYTWASEGVGDVTHSAATTTAPDDDATVNNSAAGSAEDEVPLVRTRAGILRGLRERTAAGTAYYSFRGIPYAEPPVGELRFRAPRPAEPWPGVRDATKAGHPSVQAVARLPIGPLSWTWREVWSFLKTIPEMLRVGRQILGCSEDCLYANVFTPELPFGRRQPKLPVLVFIHGGGFRMGDGEFWYGPDYLMDVAAGGLVLVTFNYRLGPLGFLAVGTEEAPGNAGLKDQVLLLRWVRDNITAFGGDPDSVTLTGESAGGVSVHLHTLSPLSRGLFHRAICASGAAGCAWALEERPLEHARRLATHLGLEDEQDPDALVRALRTLSAGHITRAYNKHMNHAFTPRLTLGMYFVPVVEPPHDGAFLVEDPLRTLAEDGQAQIPMVFGQNSREGLVIFLGINDGQVGPKSRSRKEALMKACMRQPAEHFLPTDLYRGLGVVDRDAVGREVLRHYFGLDGPGPDKFDQFIDLFGDAQFVVPVLRASRAHAAGSSAPVYHYYFSHEGELGLFKNVFRAHQYAGASHGDDLGYLFYAGSLAYCQRPPLPRDEHCRRNLIAIWTNFAKTGDPAGVGGDAIALGVDWTPRTTQDLHFLDVSDRLVMKTGAPDSRALFWNYVYKRYLNDSLF